MGQTFPFSVVIVSVFALAGCGARAAKAPAAPAADPATTYSASDCPPPPGGDMQFSFDESPKTTASSGVAALSYRPNVQEKPKTGAVHAAY